MPPVPTDPTPSVGGVTRRSALRALLLVAAGWLLSVWYALGRARRARRARRVTLPRPSSDGVAIYGEVILLSAGGRLTALHSRCPHLGCTIAAVDDGVLVCPCHGSRFDAGGRRLGGPAPSDLTPLAVTPSKEDRKVDVELPA